MLVLSRKRNQTVFIGDNLVRIIVMGIEGNRVKLGIEAPAHLSVHRGEIQAAINAGNDTRATPRELSQAREAIERAEGRQS